MHETIGKEKAKIGLHPHHKNALAYIYYIKLKSRLSDHHAGNSIVSAWIDVGLGLCSAVVSGM